MNKFGVEFYVANDLNKPGTHFETFDNVKQALDLYLSLDSQDGKMPVLGCQKDNSGVDLIHGVNGENILVLDYQNKYMSNTIKNIVGELDDIVQHLINEGAVKYQYDKNFGPLSRSSKVVVPVVSKENEIENTYIADKVLKARDGFGWTAIDSCFVGGHGWVGGEELFNNPEKYCDNGMMKIMQVNVCYVRENKFVGIDGRMDISPADFVKMAEQIQKPYCISVYDKNNYNYQYNNLHNFTVASFDTLPEAIKAWYDINEKVEFTPGVVDKAAGSCVFNGCDENFEAISYKQAAEIYGFTYEKVGDERSIDMIINDASERSGASKTGKENIEFEKE